MTVFYPNGSTVTFGFAGTNVSQNQALTSLGDALRIVNDGSNTQYVKAGVGSQTANGGDFPILPRTVAFLRITWVDDNVAVFTAGGTVVAVIQRGSAQ